MTRQRRSFDPSFKLEVVRMIKEQGLSISHVSQTMDIGVTAIRRWMAQFEAVNRHEFSRHSTAAENTAFRTRPATSHC